MTRDLLSIGAFSAATGLTTRALRLYDKKDLLQPTVVDPSTGYRMYSQGQVEDGRLIAMLRAIEMPLSVIGSILDLPPAQRTTAVSGYWYSKERQHEDGRDLVAGLRTTNEREEHGMSHKDAALEQWESNGAVAAIEYLSGIENPVECADAYADAMKDAYWAKHDLALINGLAHAGIGHCFRSAATADDQTAVELLSRAKTLTYDFASFTWPGWGEPELRISDNDIEAGKASAQANLILARKLKKGDLAESRGLWMLGAHLLAMGELQDSREAFGSAAELATKASAEPEALLSKAFVALAGVLAGEADAEDRLEACLSELGSQRDGGAFVDQVRTARRVFEARSSGSPRASTPEAP